jgi:hypothetical protein
MISRDDARSIALSAIVTSWTIEDDEPIIVDEVTIERPFGWVFFYDSLRHQRTQNLSDHLAGNAPIIVNRFDGSLHVTGTARPAEEYIREYEANLTNAQPDKTSSPDDET